MHFEPGTETRSYLHSGGSLPVPPVPPGGPVVPVLLVNPVLPVPPVPPATLPCQGMAESWHKHWTM